MHVRLRVSALIGFLRAHALTHAASNVPLYTEDSHTLAQLLGCCEQECRALEHDHALLQARLAQMEAERNPPSDPAASPANNIVPLRPQAPRDDA